MRQNLFDCVVEGLLVRKDLQLDAYIDTLAGQIALQAGHPVLSILDPGGASRDLLLPPEADSKNVVLIISNSADAAEDLVVKEDSDTTTIATITGSAAGATNQTGVFHCDGTTWRNVGMLTRNIS